MISFVEQLFKSPAFQYISEHLIQSILVIVLTLLLLKYAKELFFSNLPPGPFGLPVVGYRPALGDKPQKKLAELKKTYGGIMSLRFGPKLTIVINDYDIFKEVFSHPMALDRNPVFFDYMMDSGFGLKNGQEWEEQRRFCVQSLRDLGLGRGKWEDMIQHEVSYFVQKLSSHKGKPWDFADELATSINDNVLSLLIGRRLEAGVDDDKIQLAKDFNYMAVNFLAAHGVIIMLPKLRRLFERLRIAGFHKLHQVTTKFSKLISDEIKKRRTDEDHTGITDFINLYLKKMDAMALQNNKHNFSEKNLDGNLKILFLGGADTIFVSLGWLFRLMAEHQDVQKKVHAELDDVLGRDGKVTYEERFKVPYTVAVLMESQRYPTTVAMPVRMAHEDIVVRGYTIPKGVNIIANLYAIHHDPKYWKNPEKYDPERFLTEDGKKFIPNLPGFVPFSLGRRNCPGETIAWMEILNYFVAVMQRFEIKPPAASKVKFDVLPGLVSRLQPQALCFIERT